MRKTIATINITLDGICDHTAINADDELHDHFTEVIQQGGCILYGRKTFELMKFWKELLEEPIDAPSMNDFAKAIDQIPKIVFSNTLEHTNWSSAILANDNLEKTVVMLKKKNGNDILVGSRSIMIQLMNLHLLDELHLCIHPVVAKEGLKLFEELIASPILELYKTKCMGSGAVVHYYRIS